MCSSNCLQFIENNIQKTIKQFNENNNQASEFAANCFSNCLKNDYTKWSKISYKNENQEILEYCIDVAFSDAILKFNEKANAKKLFISTATTKTVFFIFFKFKLLEHLQKEKRTKANTKKFGIFNFTYKNDDYEDKELLYQKLEQGLKKLNDEDREIVLLRHKENKSIAEIASIIKINKNSTTNKVYRCMLKLKNIIENL